jgi:hypothetical protein
MNPRHTGWNARLYRIAWVVLIAHHVACVLVGLAGFIFETSPSIERTFGNALLENVWSSIFVLFGLLALLARLKAKVMAEMWAIGAIALARGLWCGVIIASAVTRDATSGVQVGLALGATAMFMTAWALFTIVWNRTGLLVISGSGKYPTEMIREQLLSIARQTAREEAERNR